MFMNVAFYLLINIILLNIIFGIIIDSFGELRQKTNLECDYFCVNFRVGLEERLFHLLIREGLLREKFVLVRRSYK